MTKNKWAIFITLVIIALLGLFYFTKTKTIDIKNENGVISELDGNIIATYSDGSSKILVDKNSSIFGGPGETGLYDPSISPDKTKFCFGISQGGVYQSMGYYDFNTKKIINIKANGANCLWSPDSKMIAYLNHVTDVSAINIYIYDITTSKIKQMTNEIEESTYHNNVKWSYAYGGKFITADLYKNVYPSDKKIGTVKINIETDQAVYTPPLF